MSWLGAPQAKEERRLDKIHEVGTCSCQNELRKGLPVVKLRCRAKLGMCLLSDHAWLVFPAVRLYLAPPKQRKFLDSGHQKTDHV